MSVCCLSCFRDVYEKGMKAFVSFVQFYRKHECSLIFRSSGKGMCFVFLLWLPPWLKNFWLSSLVRMRNPYNDNNTPSTLIAGWLVSISQSALGREVLWDMETSLYLCCNRFKWRGIGVTAKVKTNFQNIMLTRPMLFNNSTPNAIQQISRR